MSSDFSNLLPQTIFEAFDAQGLTASGALFPLNSYENRVYEVGLDDSSSLIAKFYRPNRWSLATLKDEHRFMEVLKEAELPIVNPISLNTPVASCPTLGQIKGYYYCLYPKFKGREHADLSMDDRKWLGRTLARLHNVGETLACPDRLFLDPQSYGYDQIHKILNHNMLPDDLKSHLETTLEQTLNLIDPYFETELDYIPLHGDCHLGNVLWNAHGLHLVDFDDMVNAPPIQDMWMLFHGNDYEMAQQKEAFFEGYNVFRDFDDSTFILTEPLRTLRMIRHAAWIGDRYQEEIFKRTFPYFGERKYWEELLLALKEQISLLQQN